jgi:MerR family transcriptional regulator, light-induced transcriptional regulator
MKLLSSKDVADLMGVTDTTVKRWSDEGRLPCRRTAGGHRRFRRADVEMFATALNGEIDKSTHDDPLLRCILKGTSMEVEAYLLSRRSRRGAWFRVCQELGEVVTELGMLWATGKLEIMEEHIASERLLRALSRLGGMMPVAASAPKALLACLENEDHTLGLALLELALRESGWDTVWAGRRTPVSSIAAVVTKGELRLVAISASLANSNPKQLRQDLEAIATTCKTEGVALAVGGGGVAGLNVSGATAFTDFESFHRVYSAMAKKFTSEGAIG